VVEPLDADVAPVNRKPMNIVRSTCGI
jgi:hypothetical protein